MDDPARNPEDTERLLGQALAGDRQAVEQLFALHRPYLHHLVELRLDPRLRPRVDPSDVVQEAQLEALRRLPEYLRQQPLPFRLWLRQLTYDRLLMAYRRHVKTARRAVGQEVGLPDRSSLLLAQQLLAGGSSPSQQVSKEEMARRVRQALAKLPEADREVLMLRTFEGLSFQEVSHLLQIEPAAARKRHGRALLRLHQLL